MKCRLKKSIIKLFLFLIPLYGIGQNQFAFKRFTTNEGLSRSYVKSIVQDQKGFLWLGTSDGLNRYDGYNFKVYRSKPGTAYTLSNNEMNVILEDHRHQLWIGTPALMLKPFGTGAMARWMSSATATSLPTPMPTAT